ncbi:MG2 domain-containing protein [Corallococcus macrosporus]|uniref:MG2 domain-containing protein n=1 Tax=Corallococcus macrosporus TaxID=35 RepID=UPI001EFCCAD2|nr:MG2 domain-containing protein [Corallococcus macrosporus]
MHRTPWTRAPLLRFWLLSLLLLASPVLGQGKAPPSWKAIEAMVDEQKLEAAAQASEARLTRARAQGDEADWTRALVRTVQLRTALHGHETAVRFLREQPWPKGVLHRATLNLFYASTLVTYAQVHGWEVRQREAVASTGPVDLKSWTYEEILTEAQRAYEEVWKQRQQLGGEPLKALAEYVKPNTYPVGLRSTVRDAVSYLRVALLADSSHWRPEQANEVYRLDLGALLEGTPTAALADPGVHPLVKVAAVLGDLEAWHQAAGRRESVLEARLQRYAVLHQHFTDKEDRTRIRQHLAAFLPAFRDASWSTMGQAQLAELEHAADHAVKAHALAKACAATHPQSKGAQRCQALVSAIEAPEFSMGTLSSDGPRRRSIEVTHRNVSTLHFRAYAFDLEKRLTRVDDYNVLPEGEKLRALVKSQRAVATWSVPLPKTGDFREHRTFVTPPLTARGTYIITASAHEDYRATGNRIVAVYLTVTHWVLITRGVGGRLLEVRVVDGDTGQPVPKVPLRLIRMDYQRGFSEAARGTSDADGMASFDSVPGEGYRNFILVAGRGRDALMHPGHIPFYKRHEPGDRQSSLVFTDRAVYRPQQKVQWKAVAYSGRGEQARYQTLPNHPLHVTLVDPNYQVVESREVRTNDFGSAAGEFTIPTGRMLGAWAVRVSAGGTARIRVEEYKRPTFEVTLKDAKAPLRLNRPATFHGEARYYFGMPVTSGAVRWRAFREPVLPWWWWGRAHAGARERQVVATGTSSLGADGGFTIGFTPEADERSAATPGLTWRYRIEADATDEGGETRSASRAFRLGFVAVETRVDLETGFAREGTPAEVRLTRATLDGAPQPGPGTWRLVALKQPAQPLLPADEPQGLPEYKDPEARFTPTPGDSLRPRWFGTWSPDSAIRGWADGEERAKGAVEHDAEGVAVLKLPPLKPGAYRLHYETKDAFGQTYTVGRELLVAGRSTPLAVPAALAAERETVRVGEVARLLAVSGFQGQPLLLDLYQGERRVWRRELTGGRSSTVVEVPVTAELRGGFTVVLSTVRDYQYISLSKSLFVPWDDKELKLEFATFRDTLRPGAKETWRVTVRGPKGAKVEAGTAELLAYMYDQSLDLFAKQNPPSVASLYPQRHAYLNVNPSVGLSDTRWVVNDRYGEVAGWKRPEPDTLRFEDGWGLGGPGRRRSRQMLRGGGFGGAREAANRAAAPLAVAAPPAPAAPPPPPPSPAEGAAQSGVVTEARKDGARGAGPRARKRRRACAPTSRRRRSGCPRCSPGRMARRRWSSPCRIR